MKFKMCSNEYEAECKTFKSFQRYNVNEGENGNAHVI